MKEYVFATESSNTREVPNAREMRLAIPGFALLLMFASGATGLVWQMVWTAQFGLALGHEIVAVLSVIAAFFGGIAAGALLLAHRLERSLHPARWYAVLECMIAIWALLVAVASPSLLPQLSHWIGAEPSAIWHWAIAFFIPFVVLLPATLAMGATLPAMERLLRQGNDKPLGWVYASNTGGAMIGLVLAVFFFIPELGLLGTSMVFAGVNGACALLAWLSWGRHSNPLSTTSAASSEMDGVNLLPAHEAATRSVALRLFLTGLLGIGYEVLAVRVLSQVTENTVYTYALLLAVFLLGTALGAALLRRSGPTVAVSAERIDRALGAVAAAIFLGGLSLWWADRTYPLPALWLGPGLAAALTGEWLVGIAAMILPAMAMGALFTLLCTQAQQTRMPLGIAVGINTFGSALAPLLVGLILLPNAGAKIVLLGLLVGYLAMRSVKSWNQPFAWAAVASVSVIAVFAAPLRFVDVPAGGRLLSYREGVMAAVSVVEDASGVARLHINNRVQEGSSASGLVETRLAQLPLLLHTSPRKALFLGYGTGYTANAAALDPRVSVKAVELLPEVIDAAGIFALKEGAPASASPVATVAADARRYVQSAAEHYDVIVSDLFHPARSGAGSLYTVEHFSAVKSRLQPGGLFCQWLALHQMDMETLRSIVAAFIEVYPNALAVLASNSLDTPVVGLIARPDEPAWRIEAVRARVASSLPGVAGALKLAHIDDEFAVLGSVVAGPEALRAFANHASVNTDDHPVVAHRAPWVNYSPGEPARDRLLSMVQSLAPRLDGVVRDPKSADAARLYAYWKARNEYLAIGMAVRPHPDPRVMLERLRDPLLAIVTMSPDFRPASEPLLALSQAVRASYPDLATQVDAALRRALSSQPVVPLTPLTPLN